MPAALPVYVPVSNPATVEEAAAIMRAAESGADVYAVSHLCHTSDGKRRVLLSLRAAGVSPEAARALGWAPGFPPGHEPPAPTVDVVEREPELAEVDPNATTVVLERNKCVSESETPAPEAEPPKNSDRRSRPR